MAPLEPDALPSAPSEEALETEKLRYELESLRRQLDSTQRDLREKEENARRFEHRWREFNAQIRDLEQRVGSFQREALAASEELKQNDETLRVCDLARGQLSAALERQGLELARWREEARGSQGRAAELEASLRRREDALERLQKQYEEACRLLARQSQAQADIERQKTDLLAERSHLLETVKRERAIAEDIRREGVEALEQARELKKK